MRKSEHRHRRRGRAGRDDDGRCRRRAGRARGYRRPRPTARSRRWPAAPRRSRRQATAMGAVPAGNRLTIQFWLKSQTAAAASYASAVSTPGNPLFEHYLTPAAYTARFGPTSAEAASVESWLKSAGFTGVSADSGRDYVRATASVSTIDAALRTQLRYYRPTAGVNAGEYPLRANDRPGLDAGGGGAQRPRGHRPGRTPRRSRPTPAEGLGRARAPPRASRSRSPARPGTPSTTRTGCPGSTAPPASRPIVCGYSADQLRAAYGYNRHNIGKGVTIALVEVGLTPDMFQTLQDYARVNRIESPSASRYAELSLGQGSACGDEFNVEEQLDVESSYDMAPLANQLVVGGDSLQQRLLRAAGPVRRRHGRTQRRRRPPAGADRVQLVGGRRRVAAGQPGQHRARLPAAGRRRGRQHALLGRRRLRRADPVERPVRHRGRRHHARHRPEGPAALRDRLVHRRLVRRRQPVGLPGRGVRQRRRREPALGAARLPARRRAELAGQGAGQPAAAWSARCPTSAPTPTRPPAWPSGC